MNVILFTLCGCRQNQQIEASKPPPGIQMELALPEGSDPISRRFSYVGVHQIHNIPVYLEDIPHQQPLIESQQSG